MIRISLSPLRRIFFFLLLILACPANILAGDIIRINGSGSNLEMIKPLVEAYVKVAGKAQFQIEKPLGSAGAIKALLAGALDIAVVARPLKAEEIAQGGKLRAYGKTPFAIVAEKSIPLKTVSTKELEDIYAGKTTKWPNGETIRVILRPNEDKDTKILKSLSPGMAEAVDKAHERRGVMIAVTDMESNEAVARTAGGIGAAALAGILVEKLPLNVLALNGIKPSRDNLADRTYPLSKDISFVTTNKLPDAAAKFLKFVYSKKGRAIAEKNGILIMEDNP